MFELRGKQFGKARALFPVDLQKIQSHSNFDSIQSSIRESNEIFNTKLNFIFIKLSRISHSLDVFIIPKFSELLARQKITLCSTRKSKEKTIEIFL